MEMMDNAINEELKNEILLKMKNHLDDTTLLILSQVLNSAFSDVQMLRTKMLPSTVDDVNNRIIDIFNMNKAPKLSKQTAKYYLDTIDRLICFTNKSLLKINNMDIETFLNSLKPNNDAVSINNIRRNISAFYTWMRKSKMILENPCENVEPYKEIHKPIDHMQPEEYEQLKKGCKHERDRALIEFLRCTAMRVGEVTDVKISDVNWREGKILIYGNKTRSYRTVYLDSVAATYLQEYIFSRGLPLNSNAYLFTSLKNDNEHLKNTGIRSSVKNIAKRANLDRKIYPHLFRKTTASNIVKRGGTIHDAGEYLGHKERTTTGQYYVYIGEEHTVDIFNKFVAAI